MIMMILEGVAKAVMISIIVMINRLVCLKVLDNLRCLSIIIMIIIIIIIIIMIKASTTIYLLDPILRTIISYSFHLNTSSPSNRLYP